MSGIKTAGTQPEEYVRSLLAGQEFRVRRNVKTLPGKPDIVIPSLRAVILVHGCFWHRHDCHLFKWPSTRSDLWKAKLNRNFDVDQAAQAALIDAGWRVLVIWECALKGRAKLSERMMRFRIGRWLSSHSVNTEIRARQRGGD